tara:strand:- start:222 stop:1202 length:981 start_codon:yes stop_codon:yes gene_type:complete
MGLETSVILAIAALATTTGTTVASGVQAGRAKKDMAAAEDRAQMFMDEARGKLDINSYDELSLRTEVFDKQRDQLAALGSNIVSAVSQSDRPMASIQNVVSAVMDSESKITDKEVKELQDLDLVQAEEESRLKDIGIQLDLGEVAGAQKEMADAKAAHAQYKKDFASGLTSTLMQGVQLGVPLFQKSAQMKGIENFSFNDMTGADALKGKLTDSEFLKGLGEGKGFAGLTRDDLTGLANLQGDELTNFFRNKLSAGNIKYLSDPSKGNVNPFVPQTVTSMNKTMSDLSMNPYNIGTGAGTQDLNALATALGVPLEALKALITNQKG